MSGLNVTLKVDKGQVAAVMKRLGDLSDQTPKAISTAINKTLPHLRTGIKNAAAKEILLPKNEILHTMKVIKASPKNISGRIYIHRKNIPLMRFKPRQTDAGVEVRVRTSGPTVIPHAFIATMPTGHTGVFVRGQPGHREKRTKNGKTYTTQLPIKELRAPTVVDVLTEKPQTLQAVRDDAQAALNKNLDSQVDWLLSRGHAQSD
jgi:hypothetical protein